MDTDTVITMILGHIIFRFYFQIEKDLAKAISLLLLINPPGRGGLIYNEKGYMNKKLLRLKTKRMYVTLFKFNC